MYTKVLSDFSINDNLILFLDKINHNSALIKLGNIFCFVAVLILLSTFSNLMAIGLVTPSPSVSFPFQTYNELGLRLLDNSCEVALIADYNDVDFYSLYNYAFTDSSIYSKAIQQVFSSEKYIIVSTHQELSDLVLSSSAEKCYAGLHYESFKTIFETKHCRLKLFTSSESVLKPYGVYTYYHTVKNLNSYLEPLMSTDALLAYVEFVQEKYLKSSEFLKCDFEENTFLWAPIKLKRVLWSFLAILIGGSTISCLCFILELCLPMCGRFR